MNSFRRIENMASSKGYPIPKSRIGNVTWVNSTPHLSQRGAAIHSNQLKLGAVDYNQFVCELHNFLRKLLVNERHIASNQYWFNLASKGSKHVYQSILDAFSEAEGSLSYMLDQLMEDKLEVKVENELAEHAVEDIDTLHNVLQTLPDNPLTAYEKKLFLKYAGDSSRRTGSGYIKQISKNYLPTRKDWLKTKMPNLDRYNRSLAVYYKLNALVGTYDGCINTDAIVGYLDRARKTTFGGYPYLHNMADFVSDDESDDTTYADLYNHLAIGYLYLSPKDKILLNPEFVALERVQPGGTEEYSGESTEYKDNKQRFVQAQSAMLSHAYKFIVDAFNVHLKSVRPTMCSDKFGEETVTADMKRLVRINFCKDNITEGDVTYHYNNVGTDYTNFDATQDVCISNDTQYNSWRMLCPAWMCYYIIDPYVVMTYRDNRIVVPRFGSVQTTGVKSGMCDTNQCDTQNCSFADIYELVYYSDTASYLSDDEIMTLMQYCMDNGDDRFKLTLCSAEMIEAADDELGYIAQKSKQEVLPIGSPASKLNITYLKTIIALINGKLVRSDAISKLILARIHPEDVSPVPNPASLVITFFMSASRSYESPYLYILVDYMYARLPYFRMLVNNEISFAQLTAKAVAEQMEILKLRRGKVWMRRKGIDFDAIVEAMNTKFGYGDEGYRGSVGALDKDDKTMGLANLVQVQAIMTIAMERKSQGLIGSTFSKGGESNESGH